ncbi:hypothetical protein [Rhizobium leguminosarum]
MLKADTTAGTARISCDSCPASMDSVMDTNPRAAREKAARVAKIALVEKLPKQLEAHAAQAAAYRKARSN